MGGVREEEILKEGLCREVGMSETSSPYSSMIRGGRVGRMTYLMCMYVLHDVQLTMCVRWYSLRHNRTVTVPHIPS